MNYNIFIIILLFLSFDSFCQEFDCTIYYKEYCENLGADSIILPNYTAGYFYSGKNTDSSETAIPNCINDLDAFCSGVEQALKSNHLSIRQVGDPGHVSPCSYAAYENHGVYLIMTGDIITDARIFDENAGFNFIMKQRIKDSLGMETYRILGKKDSNLIEFNDAQVKALSEMMLIEMSTDTTIQLTINKDRLANSELKNLKGVIFTDALSKTNYTYDEILIGITLKLKGDKKKRAYLRLNFEAYENPKFCKSRFNPAWTIPINLVE